MIRGLVRALVLAALLAVGYGLVSYYRTVDLAERVVTIIIKPGDGFSEVANHLVDNQVVRSGLLLKAAARLRGIDKKLTPGRYDFSHENTMSSVLTKLEQADFVNIKVTIYEGAPIWATASILAESMQVDSAIVVQLNTDSLFLSGLEVPGLEGYLFPETYFFPWGTGVETIITDMVAMFKTKTDPIWPSNIASKLTREEIIVLASIIEAEALIEDEKPKIASVYQNRLDRRMKLDADPTVIYGLGGLDRPLSLRDLRRQTPYNTYRKKGLPPTPINSPGLGAIKAALSPAATDFLYFVADGTGGHRFSKTNAEHNRARRDIKRERRASGS